MRTSIYKMSQFAERRKRLSALVGDSIVIIPAHPEYIRNNDVHYPYRQDSNLFYLTGFEEPGSVFVLRPGRNPESILFVLPKDVASETWTGFRYGPDETKKQFGIDQTFSIKDLDTELPKFFKEQDRVYYSMYINSDFDKKILEMSSQLALTRSRSNKGHLNILDLRPVIGELRLKKTGEEIVEIKKACQISAQAHVDVMKACKPGINERALHGVFLKGIMERGAAREGYGTIVASGSAATTLHYVFNDQPCRDGDMLLIDGGAEFNFYTGDITRTYPVNGKFNQAQARVYQKVLNLQKSLVAAVKPGETREGMQKQTISGLVDIMMEEKLLRGSKSEILDKKEYLKFYPHGVSHWLGLDVHDIGITETNGEPRPYEPGFLLTVEPGLYVPIDMPGVPDDLRGIGIRIEDDILVTNSGNENLTEACPKEIAELEALIGRS